jgi:type II secretory pathway predicted ATPase ExeA
MSVLNENEVKLYIQEKYISNTLSNENIFTDKIVKKIYRLSNGITDRVDILCLQYLDDPVKRQQKLKVI